MIARPALLGTASAVSAGVVAGASLLDLAYREDHVADMDLNLVADDQGRVIELQCSAESRAVPRAVVDGLVSLSLQVLAEMRDLQRGALRDAGGVLSVPVGVPAARGANGAPIRE
jgi:ribonuclease PH